MKEKKILKKQAMDYPVPGHMKAYTERHYTSISKSTREYFTQLTNHERKNCHLGMLKKLQSWQCILTPLIIKLYTINIGKINMGRRVLMDAKAMLRFSLGPI